MGCQADFVLQREGESMNWLTVVELGISGISTGMISMGLSVLLNIKDCYQADENRNSSCIFKGLTCPRGGFGPPCSRGDIGVEGFQIT